jgi:hypothetical protein
MSATLAHVALLLEKALHEAPLMRGYICGDRDAARYLGVDRKAFRQWADDTTVNGRELFGFG